MPENQPILIIDDSANDRFLLRRAFEKAGVLNPFREVDSGKAAIAYLNGEGAYADREQYPFPSILLLDLHMPSGNGFEVLEWIRNKLASGRLLIIVLSNLDQMKSINRAYELGANSFLTKPGNSKELEELITGFRNYWILRNRGPQIDKSITDL